MRYPGYLKTATFLLLSGTLSAQAEDGQKVLLFGDTHLHTSYSFDAFMNQNRSAGPDTAYRYAKGLPVIHPYHRARLQIETPLDFLVVSDHAELLGFLPASHNGTLDLEDLGWWGNTKRWVALKFLQWALNAGLEASSLFADLLPAPPETLSGDPVKNSSTADDANDLKALLGDVSKVTTHAWHDITDTAERHYEPGVFTTFAGWEWSSIPGGANLHRVIITPDDTSITQRYLPFGADQSAYPEDLWTWLHDRTEELGARFISIPHNSNISKGYMFAQTTLRGNDITADYARTRSRWEPLVEITQIKGDSETHPQLSPDDPFADFEEFPFYLQSKPTPYKAASGDYIRSALKSGLALGQKTGVNPYQFGVIGSTDAHTGLASAEENNFWGKLAIDSIPEHKSREAMAKLMDAPVEIINGGPTGWDMSASGLAAVWATENTRDAIFDAMQRREVYGTTGPRLQLRLFAGWNFEPTDAQSEDLAAIGYRKGVPMGAQLSRSNDPEAVPALLIQAAKDPLGANIMHVQVIKGWLASNGQQQEKIYDVIEPHEQGVTHTATVWSDPDYNASEAAFYYVRVIQVPTPRHSYYDKQALNMETTAEDIIQERAYSSSIWYTP